MLDRKYTSGNEGTRVATLSEEVKPSSATQKTVRQEAAKFAQTHRTPEALKAAAEADARLTYEDGIVVGPNDFVVGQLGSSTSSRDLVKYAFKPRDGAVSPLVYSYKAPNAFYDGQYVVAAVTGEIPAGVPTWQAIRGQVEGQVRNRKKAAMVAEAGTDLGAIASRYGVEADTARAINFDASFVPQLGAEPSVLAKAFSLPVEQTSEPIAGNAGVYVVKPLVRTDAGDATGNVTSIRQRNGTQTGSNVRNRLGLSMRENAEVEDNRSRFY